MRFYRVLQVAIVCGAAALLAAGCGGGKPLTTVDVSGGGSAASSLHVEYLPPSDYHGLRRQVNYDYDYSGFPMAEGTAVVPLGIDLAPDPANAGRYSITSETAGDGRVVSVSCADVANPVFHVWLDPALWRVHGVGIPDAVPGDEPFVGFAHLTQEGLLEVCVPASPQGDALASGEVARVHLVPADAPRQASTLPPGDEWIYGAAFWCHGNPPTSPDSYGNVHVRLDGEYGDEQAEEKDGQLDDGIEASRYERDNRTHDVVLTNFGQVHGWDEGLVPAGFHSFAQMDLTWTERLVGDYDNDGCVTLLDAYVVDELWEPAYDGPENYMSWPIGDPAPQQTAQSHLLELSEPGYDTFFDMMRTPSWRDVGACHFLETYYILTPDDAPHDWSPDPGGPERYYFRFNDFGDDHGMTHAKNAVDGFWDGYVRDYLNWDSNGDGQPNGYYHFPDLMYGVETWSAPGDTLPIHYHFGECIDGYQLWSIPSDLAGAFNPEYPGSHAKQLFFTNRESYADQPWNLDAPECYRRADLQTLLADVETSFDLGYASVPGQEYSYDIMIVPFAYEGHSQPVEPRIIHYGIMTRLCDVLVAVPEEYGPQYVDGDAPDGDNEGHGITGVAPVEGEFDPLHLEFTYQNADVIDRWYQWAGLQPAGEVHYKLYAWALDASGSRATEEQVRLNMFNNPYLTKLWVEESGEASGPNEWCRDWQFTSGEGSLPFETDGAYIYFGIRAADETGAITEYSFPDSPPDGNCTYFEYQVDLSPYGPQYVAAGTLYDGDGDPLMHTDAQVGMISVTQTGPTTFDIVYNNADEVREEDDAPAWGEDRVLYRLYVSGSEGGIFDEDEIDEWTEGDRGELQESGGNAWRREGLAIDPADYDVDVGENLYFGVKAYDTETMYIEYTPWEEQAPHVVQPCEINDYEPPHFIVPSESGEYDPDATPADTFLTESYSYDNAVAFYFLPAIDPPNYDPAEEITYALYWSLDPFVEEDIGVDADVYEHWFQKSFSYDDLYDDTKWPHFNAHELEYILDDQSIGVSLAPGDPIWFYVQARDDDGNASTGYPVCTDAARLVSPTDGCMLASDLACDECYTTGSLDSDDEAVYLLYPSAYVEGSPDRTAVDYRVFTDGALLPPQSDVLVDASYEPGAKDNADDLNLAHQVNNLGAPVFDDNGDRKPVVAYRGYQYCLDPWTVLTHTMSSARKDNGDWALHTWHDQDYPLGQDPPFWGHHSYSQLIAPFSYESGVDYVTMYILAWMYLTPNGGQPDEIRLKTSESASSWPSAWSVRDTVQLSCDMDLISRSTDLPRALAWAAMHMGNPLPMQRFYLLAGSAKHDLALQMPVVRIYATSDCNAWDTSNVTQQFLSAGFVDGECAVNPNALEVVTDPFQGSVYVYVVHADALAEAEDNSDSDHRGLSIAVGTDNGQGPTGWTRPFAAGLIDDEFFDGASNYRNDSVDLRVKPDSRLCSYSFQDLGCAYVSPEGYLYLAETIGNGPSATWHRLSVGPGASEELDEGQIRWVKLVYFVDETETAVPYLLYGRKINARAGWEVVFWRPGGFG